MMLCLVGFYTSYYASRKLAILDFCSCTLYMHILHSMPLASTSLHLISCCMTSSLYIALNWQRSLQLTNFGQTFACIMTYIHIANEI